jgi:sacsin
LRDEHHLENETILQKTWKTPEIDQVIKPFEDSAHEFLLFTNLVTIEVQYRGIPRHRKGWIIHAERLEVHRQDLYQSEIVSIERIPLPSGSVKRQRWNVVRLSFPRDELGDFRQLAIKYRLRCPVSLGLAAPLGKNNAIEPKLFSTVPLSIISTLPVHLTAPFILSSDRRQIRLDGYDTSESKYNTQLLVARIPELYLFLQADLLRRFGDNQHWWPGDVKEEDKITRSAVEAFYGTHLKVSEQHVFLSLYNAPHSLLPRDSVVLGPGLPPLLKSKLFPAFKPHQLIALSSRASKRAIEEGDLSHVDPLFVKSMIMQNTDILGSLGLEMEEVQVLLRFICRNDVTSVIGLPLLPLADDSFAVFEECSSACKVYYVWEHSPLKKPVFHLDHLIHPKFAVKDFLDVGLNVEKLTDAAVKILVDEILDEGEQRDDVSHTDQEWITTFWSEYHIFASDTTLDDISSYPIVPTIQRGKHISISRCRDRSAVVFSDVLEPSSLWDWLTELDITVVPRHSSTFPNALQRVLGSNDDFPSFDFRKLLAVLEPTSEAILGRKFSGMSAKSRKAFAQWARGKIPLVPADGVPIARRLPIWSLISARNTRATELGSAQDLIMLPAGMPGEVAKRFMNTPVAVYSAALRHLQVDPLSLPEFIARLQLPANLPSRDVSVYKQLMLAISASHRPSIPDLRVPNGNRELCPINTLYGRDPLFLAAFSPGSQQFVLDDIHEYEDLLTGFGLKRQANLNLAMFEACALAIHNDTAEDRVARAVVVFHAYAEELSVRINFAGNSWTQLDAIRFIPRSAVRQTKMEGAGIDVSGFVNPFPDLVAPNEILQAQHEAIAWTQRVLFAEHPNQRIMVAYPELGCPSVAEVVSPAFTLIFSCSIDDFL